MKLKLNGKDEEKGRIYANTSVSRFKNERKNEWMNKWMNEWMNDKLVEGLKARE